jgi:hypothetical protein
MIRRFCRPYFRRRMPRIAIAYRRSFDTEVAEEGFIEEWMLASGEFVVAED